MSLNTAYASTIPAIFKIVEVIIDIILIILVAVSPIYVVPGAGGWLFFVAILTLLISMFFYLIHLTNAIFKLAGPMTLVVRILHIILLYFYFNVKMSIIIYFAVFNFYYKLMGNLTVFFLEFQA
uniref:Hypotheticial protein n=1 Tax=Schistosoma japonicum TaxID=6182 RepID=C1L601_SCHJA|nr:hypotheticial protein [Schistosoma japonicum]